MTDVPEESTWDEDDSRHFIDYGAYFVPEREIQVDTICSVIPAPKPGSRFVEICSGEGLLAVALAQRFPGVFIHALDGSETMLTSTATRLDAAGAAHETSRIEIADTAWRQFDTPIHAFVSSLAIHHLDGPGKARLHKDLSDALAPGGALVVCDLVEARTPETLALWERHWDEGVQTRALELDGDTRMLDFFRKDGWNYYTDPQADPGDQPSTLYEQLNWMSEAGLVGADVHWLKAGHAVFSARKPGS